jgi:rSAM/selenodomain-associated transferase 1
MVCAIAIMAKAPLAGRSKTRLLPVLRPDQAAALSAAFLRDMTENLREAGAAVSISPYVAYAPAGQEDLFEGILAPGTQLVLADGSPAMPAGVEGFGRCLLHAIHQLFAAGYDSACVLNSDSPTLPTTYLRQAAEYLARPGDRAVLGPAEDGGYYLLGLKRAHARLFIDIAWSTEQVAGQTRDRAREAGVELAELPPWYDVDEPSSLDRLRHALAAPAGIAYPAPFTDTCLKRMQEAARISAAA